MLETLFGFYSKSPAAPLRDTSDPDVARELRRRKWSVFLSITFGYGFYYVCRLSFSVVKKPLADTGILDASEMGLIGSALFFAYAFGKLTNGILVDRVNVRKFMATGLLISALANLALGFTTTFIGTAVVVSSLGWMWGFRIAGLVCLVMCVLIWKCLHERPEVYGLPGVVHPKATQSIGAKQWAVFKNPYVWILALSSAFFYMTHHAVNSWGIFFLEAEKGYSTLEASSIVSAIAGILGTFFSGMLSDKL